MTKTAIKPPPPWRPSAYSVADTVRAVGIPGVPEGTLGRVVEVYRLVDFVASPDHRCWTYTVAWATTPRPTYTSKLSAFALWPVWR